MDDTEWKKLSRRQQGAAGSVGATRITGFWLRTHTREQGCRKCDGVSQRTTPSPRDVRGTWVSQDFW